MGDLCEYQYNTISEYFESKKNESDSFWMNLKETNRNMYWIFLLNLEEFITIYGKYFSFNMDLSKDNDDNDDNSVFACMVKDSMTPWISGYCYSFKNALIHFCDCCTSIYMDVLFDDSHGYKTCKDYITDFFESRTIVQIKNIDKNRPIKVLCDGNYFVRDSRIIINQ